MIKVFYGPNKEFIKLIPSNIRPKSLTQLVEKHDINSRKIIVAENSTDNIKTTKSTISNLVIKSHEYSMLTNSGFNSFISIFNNYNIKNLYVQNPPNIILRQLIDLDKDIEIIEHNYNDFENSYVKKFNDNYDKNIFGQNIAKDKILTHLYQLSNGYNNEKPLVLLFYGPTGVGKTETAKYLSNLLGENLFRKQLSMYQSSEFGNYVFGGNHSESSLARDLLERESNVILFDEFDKANSFFYSAFYQMFDEGVFEDKNYKVNLKNSIIICTSNFLNIYDIKDTLGDAIYSRIDSAVEFKPLDHYSVEKLIKLNVESIYSQLKENDKNKINKYEVESKLLKYSKDFNNSRKISKFVKDYIFSDIVNITYS